MNENRKLAFKSISLRQDADHPERFAHFYPTSKSTNVIRAILQGDPQPAALVVASYGSGKSLAAGTAALIVGNTKETKQQLKELAKRLLAVDKKLGKVASKRIASRKSGVSLLLEGSHENLPETLFLQAKNQLSYLKQPSKTTDIIDVLDAIADRASKQGKDHIAIIWDEFGRHLEALAATGKAENLLTIQQVAEWVDRQHKPSASITLLLHQNLAQYASSLSQSTQSNWRKIEGRFSTLSYIEDSDEFYEIIAAAVTESRTGEKIPLKQFFMDQAKNANDTGMFRSYAKRKDLTKLFRDAYPLLPATLYMLPRMAARLSQNERTIFSYLRETDLQHPQSLLNLYHYFSPAMEADTGTGGAYRRWLETESAMSKVSDPLEHEIIAAAALLGLGGSGERTRVGKQILVFAVTNAADFKQAAVAKAVNSLISRKLLLYRSRVDDISVWHGTDSDLRGRLETEKNKLATEENTLEFLINEHAAPSWRPIEHNVKYNIRRYYRGKFALAHDFLKEQEAHPALTLANDEDGAVVYCLAETIEEIEDLCELFKTYRDHGTRLVFAIPKTPLIVSDLVNEIQALRSIQGDHEFIATDPFVLPELQHMIDAAQENLTSVLSRLVHPDSLASTWICDGRVLKGLRSDFDLRQKLSIYATARYGKTPIINNELIVKRVVSRPMVNARKKLILRILEQSGNADLSLDPLATTPDVALYRTVLKNTGLYGKVRKTWEWTEPTKHKKGNLGLTQIWKMLSNFFAKPGEGKLPADLFSEMIAPPYGTRKGLIPILFAAGMKAFGQAIAIRKGNEYLVDILASEIEEICSKPDEFTVEVLGLDRNTEKYLQELIQLFGGTVLTNEDLLRQLYDALVRWKSLLPVPALTTSQVSAEAKSLQKALRHDIDPVRLAFATLPSIVSNGKITNNTIKKLTVLCKEIEQIVDQYVAKAIAAMYELLTVSPDAPGDMLQRAHAWAACFDAGKNSARNFDITSKAVLSRAFETSNSRYTESSFALALSAILIGRKFEQWDDTSAQLFIRQLREVVINIEHTAIMSSSPSKSLKPLLEQRVKYLSGILAGMEDKEHSEKVRENQQFRPARKKISGKNR